MAIKDFIPTFLGAKTSTSVAVDTSENRSFQTTSVFANVSDNISDSQAMTFSAVWNAIRLLSETVSCLPISVYSKDSEGNKQIESSSPISNLIKIQPNGYQSKVVFFEKIMLDLTTRGNSFVKIVRNGLAIPVALIPLDFSKVKVIKKDNLVFYQVGDEVYDSTDILHFKILTTDGIMGISPIDQCRNSILWGKELETYGRKFFSNGAKLSGTLETDQVLKEPARERLKNAIKNQYSKVGNSHGTMVLEQGLKFKPVSISQEAAQFLASRSFSVIEVARIFNLPPHKLQELSKASFSNIEMQSQEFVTYSLTPYLSRIEEELSLKLFRYDQLGSWFAEFNVNGLLRGNIKDRSEFYSKMIMNGVMSVNEVRKLENLNKIEDGGDSHFLQVNMTTLDKIGETPQNIPNNGKE